MNYKSTKKGKKVSQVLVNIFGPRTVKVPNGKRISAFMEDKNKALKQFILLIIIIIVIMITILKLFLKDFYQ